MKKIVLDSTGLHQETAYWLARISVESYIKKSKKDYSPDADRIFRSLQKRDSDFISVKGFSRKSSHGIITSHKLYNCIAFRGTDHVKNWLYHTNILKISTKYGVFHRGFWKACNLIWDDMYEYYKELAEKSEKPLLLTGHSVGGSIASIAAAILEYDNYPVHSIYTFGQPRVLTKKCAHKYDKQFEGRYYRFRYRSDIAAAVPHGFLNFKHVGEYVHIYSDNKTESKMLKFIKTAFKRAVETSTKKRLRDIEDHAMMRYLIKIDKWNYTERKILS